MSLLTSLAPFGLALGVVVFIELLEIEALGLNIDPLVTAPDMVMVNRSLSGLFGNLCRLEASGRWRDLLAPYTNWSAPADETGAAADC